MRSADTIAAVATAPGRAGIGIIRVSGPAVPAIVRGLTGRELPPRQAVLCNFRAADGEPIDRGVALYFPAPRSYTGEDVLELQGHGGSAVLQSLLRRCAELGARSAEPGEFTRRAFLNDKLDLAQAEGVADLIDASSELAARGAMRSLAGEFSSRIRGLIVGLTALRALVEATLDFPEEDIDVLEKADAVGKLAKLRLELDEILKGARLGNILREGARVVLIGQPNVGKSSLLNRLAGDEVAIVTEIPGTTRDPLRHQLAIDGVPLHVIDTAGLRDSIDMVEKLGIERTWREIATADIALLVMDVRQGLSEGDRAILDKLPSRLIKIFVINKIDLINTPAVVTETADRTEIRLSAKTGEGLEFLRQALLHSIGWQPAGEVQFVARERHLQALTEAQHALERAAAGQDAVELFAEELRLAQQALARITGEFSADDLLGEIFSRFCIGK
jgi:tRNA modification GTPase